MTWQAPKDYSEFGVKRGAKLNVKSVDYPDLVKVLDAIRSIHTSKLCAWLDTHADEFDKRTVTVEVLSAEEIPEQVGDVTPMLIVSKRGMSHVRHLNTLLNGFNDALAPGGYLWCHTRTSALKHQVIRNSHPGAWGKLLYGLHYSWHRVMARLKLTRWFYMWVTKGLNRSYSRVEILGRMYRAGFEVVDERFAHGEFWVLGKKVREPHWEKARIYGAFVRLPRIGYKGKVIKVIKLRTMYPYSEYLQPYMLEHEGLEQGGKFARDYRINYWGRKFRSTWIDEMPMLVNLLKGQMKLVGVRPLSKDYLALYSPEMQEMHVSVKPGLLPPFYYEGKTPEGIEEVQESERRYIEAYRKHPFRTDCRYFCGIVRNILFKHKRSK